MVAISEGYYGEPLYRERGVTKGDPLSPTIFNVVVGVVVYHWESLMTEGASREESRGKEAVHP